MRERIGPHGLIAWIVALVWASAVLCQPLPDGPPFVVEHPGYAPRVSADEDGNFVVVWYTLPPHPDPKPIRAQRFDHQGSSLGTPFDVGVWRYGAYSPRGDVTMTGGGEFVVTWGFEAQRFDAAGNPSGSRIPIYSGWTFGGQFPAIDSSSAGEFVITFVDDYLGDYPGDVKVRAFESDGTGHPQIHVDSAFYTEILPDVGADDSGNFVVVWKKCCATYEIVARRFDASGPLAPEIVVNPGASGGRAPSIAMDPEGEFVVAWIDDDDFYGQRFDGSATAVGPRFTVAEDASGGAYGSRPVAVAKNALGDSVVVYTRNDEVGCCVFGQSYQPDGAADGPAFRIDDGGPWPRNVDVAMDPGGNFIAVWEECGLPYCQDVGVHRRRYCGKLRVSDPPGQAACEGGPATFEVLATGRMPFTHQWRLDRIDLFDDGIVGGSTTPTLTIDPVSVWDAGTYDVVVDDTCATPSTITSGGAALSVFLPVDEISGLTVDLTDEETALHFNWTDDSDADDYVLLMDASANGPFTDVAGVGSNGTTGIETPLPPDTRFYLVSGRNAGCGLGP